MIIIGTWMGPFGRILKSNDVEIDIVPIGDHFIFSFGFFSLFVEGKRENEHIMFSIQEYSNQLFFRAFLKNKNGECRDSLF